MAMVYGSAQRERGATNLIIVAHPHSGPRGLIGRHDAPPSLRKAQSRLFLESLLVLEMIPEPPARFKRIFAPKPRVLSRPGAQRPAPGRVPAPAPFGCRLLVPSAWTSLLGGGAAPVPAPRALAVDIVARGGHHRGVLELDEAAAWDGASVVSTETTMPASSGRCAS